MGSSNACLPVDRDLVPGVDGQPATSSLSDHSISLFSSSRFQPFKSRINQLTKIKNPRQARVFYFGVIDGISAHPCFVASLLSIPSQPGFFIKCHRHFLQIPFKSLLSITQIKTKIRTYIRILFRWVV